jgi:hypothetical protein
VSKLRNIYSGQDITSIEEEIKQNTSLSENSSKKEKYELEQERTKQNLDKRKEKENELFKIV